MYRDGWTDDLSFFLSLFLELLLVSYEVEPPDSPREKIHYQELKLVYHSLVFSYHLILLPSCSLWCPPFLCSFLHLASFLPSLSFLLFTLSLSPLSSLLSIPFHPLFPVPLSPLLLYILFLLFTLSLLFLFLSNPPLPFFSPFYLLAPLFILYLPPSFVPFYPLPL